MVKGGTSYEDNILKGGARYHESYMAIGGANQLDIRGDAAFDDYYDEEIPLDEAHTQTSQHQFMMPYATGARNQTQTVASRVHITQLQVLSHNPKGASQQNALQCQKAIYSRNVQEVQSFFCQFQTAEFLDLAESVASASTGDLRKFATIHKAGEIVDALRHLTDEGFLANTKRVSAIEIIDFILDDPRQLCVAGHNFVHAYSQVMLLEEDITAAMHRYADRMYFYSSAIGLLSQNFCVRSLFS